MHLRNHPELPKWPDHNDVAAEPPLEKPEDLLTLRIKHVRISTPSRIHLVLDYGSGTCIWTKTFNDGKFAVAMRDNQDKLIGKSLQEAGDIDIT